ncbi:MAG: hypothetical protein GY726_04325 [Proteobacteria bacterium]|nr:hypothetical protein [Pseudomonadota bacterium]
MNNDSLSKSLSIEDTYAVDLQDLEACQHALDPLFEGLLKRHALAHEKSRVKARRLGRAPQSLQPKTLVLKMRFRDFVTTTAQQAGSKPDLAVYRQLCERAYARGERPVRLLGLGMMFDMAEPAEPLSQQ